jgi:hypothetical protein
VRHGATLLGCTVRRWGCLHPAGRRSRSGGSRWPAGDARAILCGRCAPTARDHAASAGGRRSARPARRRASRSAGRRGRRGSGHGRGRRGSRGSPQAIGRSTGRRGRTPAVWRPGAGSRGSRLRSWLVCQAEQPDLSKVARVFADRVGFVGVSYATPCAPAAPTSAASMSLTRWPTTGPGGRGRAGGCRTSRSRCWSDKQGRIAERFDGGTTAGTLRDALAYLVGE